MKSFQQTQLLFTQHLREPAQYPPPDAMEDRRLGIYRELIYNNIENLLATVFPVLRSIIDERLWHSLVRDFIHRHHCQTPYFLEISEEFLQYLAQERGLREGDPEFLLELAHYEWVELALDISTEVLPALSPLPADLMAAQPRVSPLLVSLAYQYPVHKVSPRFTPTAPEPTQLLVYRNRADKVCFMEANPLTQRLLILLQTESMPLAAVINKIGAELQHHAIAILADNSQMLIKHLHQLDVITHFE